MHRALEPGSPVNKSFSLFVVITLVLLIGLFVLFKPDQPPAPVEAIPAPPPSDVVEAPTDAPPARENVAATPSARLTIRHGELVDGPAVIRIPQGESLRLSIASDAPGEWHLHGYDIHAELAPGVPVDMEFVAEHSGRFEHELHGSSHHGGHAALGVIEVYPSTP